LAGGGGERVLWAAVIALAPDSETLAILYDGSTCSGNVHDEASRIVNSQFGIPAIPANIEFVDIGEAAFLRPDRFPRFTLVLQALNSMAYALRCLLTIVPSTLIDTTGAPFAAPIWKLFGACRVILYTHYPFISTDMLMDVKERRQSVNNPDSVANSQALTRTKVLYYRVLCWLYGLSGKFVDVCCVNSSWTRAHIRQIYGKDPVLVYPPCDCTKFLAAPAVARDPDLIISVGQYRPEKDHDLQLNVMKILRENHSTAKLTIVGGVRNNDDQKIVDRLQARINTEGLSVTLKTNLPFDELMALYAEASVGLHTMRNEHFGICVVEYIAAGLIPVAHNSAGPKMDIVKRADWLAESAEEYANKVQKALDLSGEDRARVVSELRDELAIFGVEAFQRDFRKAVSI
jgi:alpha-1,2-mannosyltransferase